MARKITMRGDRAQYIERRAKDMPDDDREIVMEGEHVRYEELQGMESPHFPQTGIAAEEGRRLYELLVRGQFIAADTSLAVWLYTMGYTTEQPPEVRPIAWLKNVQLAQVMLRGVCADLIARKQLSVSALSTLAEKCFTKDGKPLRLAKFKAEPSTDNDLLENFFRPFPT